jgi:hypothetical protein
MSRYRIRYSFEASPIRVMTRDLGAVSPIAALNQFHTVLQLEENIDAQLYKIESVSLVYPANANQRTGDEMVESTFDLPKCSNPILKKKVEVSGVKQEAWF